MNIFLRKIAFLALLIAAPSFAASKTETVWSDDHDYVRLQATETGATNSHPATLSPERLTTLLMSTQVKNSDDRYVSLFKDSESKHMAEIFCNALKKAGPNQDLVFFTTERRGDSLVPTKSAVVGRLFVANNKINLIVGESRLVYLAQLNVNKVMPPYSQGSRITDSKVDLRSDGSTYAGTANRRDWLAWNINEDAPAAVTAPASNTGDTKSSAPTGTTNSAPSPAHTDSYYAEQEQRLRRLQRLHDQGLITEQEFQSKRQEILREY